MSKAFRLSVLLSASLAALPAIAGPAPKVEDVKKPQIVLISFDGAHDLAQWKRSRELAARTGARFTYFLSCVFLLSRETRGSYQAPGRSAGKSNVGFAMTKKEVVDRLGQINLAAAEGHDIASHACGHFDGGKWSKAEWTKEFDAFSTIMRDAYKINGISPEPEGWASIAASVKGFRAPYLSDSKGLTATLRDKGFAYNASGVSHGPEEPRLNGTMLDFALPQIPEGPSERRIIAMDYNLFVRHSGGVDKPEEAAKYESRAYGAFRKAFDTQYAGGRVALQIGFHFTLMNDGAYWRALERFAGEVCVKSDVECISYADYVARRNEAPVQTGG
ncbi:polysaccharide deacetylase [Aminobacter carboxidus]|uniref:Polysaccharide deacetylase n=1 Tax=Aminobacter carboxidus TaxID=376165 RepID=A0ABR9GGT3_9HYPH|nr:polysaccharide deacetylase [Aminobacter carboxidus]MBE1202876.1 polysaccharide deacetylase [Aminobacter carboxidus]